MKPVIANSVWPCLPRDADLLHQPTLVDANFDNNSVACNSLAAFINAVEAQRGKKITSAQGDQLIGWA